MNLDGAQMLEIIHTRILRRGKGIESDPVRIVEQFWSKDGTLLAENDPEYRHIQSGHVHTGFEVERRNTRNTTP